MRCTILKISCLFILVSCTSKTTRINQLVNSEKLEDRMEAYYLIGEKKDFSKIEIMFSRINNSQISHNKKFYGMSEHYCILIALKKISGLNPPNKINYYPDVENIHFYYDWAVKNGYTKNIDSIDSIDK